MERLETPVVAVGAERKKNLTKSIVYINLYSTMCNLQNWSFLLGIQNECFENESPQVEIFFEVNLPKGDARC